MGEHKFKKPVRSMPLLESILKLLEKKSNDKSIMILNELNNSIKIKIDEIVEYFYKTSPKEIWEDFDFVNIAPPFDSFWMEFSMPEYSNNEGDIIRTPSIMNKIRNGFLFRYFECKQNSFLNKWMVSVICFSNIGETLQSLKIPRLLETEIFVPIGVAMMHLDARGSMLSVKYLRENNINFENSLPLMGTGEEKRGMYFLIPSKDREAAEYFRSVIDSTISVCLFAIYLMHCKNVTVKKNIYPDHEIREYQKRYGRAPVKYYTIDIEPAKTILKDEGGIHQVGLQKSLHLCRGHFKHFEEGGGLFGKYHGTYWWPQIMRGNKDFGEIKKDYNIKPPQVEN